MPVSELVMVCLMAFVLLAPTLMVAVLISGVSRRNPLTAAPALAARPEPAHRTRAAA